MLHEEIVRVYFALTINFVLDHKKKKKKKWLREFYFKCNFTHR